MFQLIYELRKNCCGRDEWTDIEGSTKGGGGDEGDGGDGGGEVDQGEVSTIRL